MDIDIESDVEDEMDGVSALQEITKSSKRPPKRIPKPSREQEPVVDLPDSTDVIKNKSDKIWYSMLYAKIKELKAIRESVLACPTWTDVLGKEDALANAIKVVNGREQKVIASGWCDAKCAIDLELHPARQTLSLLRSCKQTHESKLKDLVQEFQEFKAGELPWAFKAKYCHALLSTTDGDKPVELKLLNNAKHVQDKFGCSLAQIGEVAYDVMNCACEKLVKSCRHKNPAAGLPRNQSLGNCSVGSFGWCAVGCIRGCRKGDGDQYKVCDEI